MISQLLGIGITGTSLTDLEREVLEEMPPYGVVLFARNVESVSQFRELCAEIKEIAAIPPILMIDQEGGRVDRLRNLLPGFPAAESYRQGERSEEVAARAGRLTGRALRYFGIECNLAPVIDVERETQVKGFERRLFSRDANEVIRLADAFMRAQQESGVGACLKHFPGSGAGVGDPHYGATIVNADVKTLMEIDLKPFAALGDVAEAIMIGHGTYPQIDPAGGPASLSRIITTGLLRDELHFEGVAISDDMEMHAVSDLGSYRSIAEGALMAGNDVILFCSQIERIKELVRDLSVSVRENEAIEEQARLAISRGERYRTHCARLVEDSDPINDFATLQNEMAELGELVRNTRNDGGADQRFEPSSTGKTGREEWT